MPRTHRPRIALAVAISVTCLAVSAAPAVAHRTAAGASARARASHSSAPTVVRVVARDYAFDAPDSVSAGAIALEFENHGQHQHELLVGLLRPGATASDVVAAHQRGLSFRLLTQAYLAEEVSGMLFAGPGQRSPAQLVVPVERGRSYVLLCQLRDTVGAQPHVLLGMFRLIHAR